MALTVELNDASVVVDDSTTLLTFLHQRKQRLAHPDDCRELGFIHNARCPLVRMLEVNGEVVPIATWADRPVREGMVIRTRSPLDCR